MSSHFLFLYRLLKIVLGHCVAHPNILHLRSFKAKVSMLLRMIDLNASSASGCEPLNSIDVETASSKTPCYCFFFPSFSGHGKGVDWWAMGILIHEMIVGYPPFYDDSPLAIYQVVIMNDSSSYHTQYKFGE